LRRILILRHGILINRWFLEPMASYFRRRGYEVYNSTYRSTRKLIEEHARDLSEEVRRIESTLPAGIDHELYFIAHSMGALVLRYALTHFPMPPVRRIVLVTPPNQGSITARWLARFSPYRWVAGTRAGAQLAAEFPGIYTECGIPLGTEIGIIAGRVRLHLLPVPFAGPHDGVVEVEEARLDAFPVKELRYGHTPMLFSRRMWEEARHFLEQGTFRR
jgi:pimeloyl-ACP methyl ester carboxylesterase